MYRQRESRVFHSQLSFCDLLLSVGSKIIKNACSFLFAPSFFGRDDSIVSMYLERGAVLARTPSEVAKLANVVITMLPSALSVMSYLFLISVKRTTFLCSYSIRKFNFLKLPRILLIYKLHSSWSSRARFFLSICSQQLYI